MCVRWAWPPTDRCPLWCAFRTQAGRRAKSVSGQTRTRASQQIAFYSITSSAIANKLDGNSIRTMSQLRCVIHSTSARLPYKRIRTSRAIAEAKGISSDRLHSHLAKAHLKRYRREPAQQRRPPYRLHAFGSASPGAAEGRAAETSAGR